MAEPDWSLSRSLLAFGALVSEGTDDFDVSWLVDVFKHAGVVTEVLDAAPRRQTTIRNIADAVDNRKIPIVCVDWDDGLAAHWLLVIGYQGYQANDDDELQITHLLCLDPTSDAPRVSLWNAVIEVFTEEGKSVNEGRYYCQHWGPTPRRRPAELLKVFWWGSIKKPSPTISTE